MKRLENDTDLAAAEARQGVLIEGIERGSVDHHLSAVGTLQSRHHHEERRFSRTRRPDQAERFARSYAQADILENVNARCARTERQVDVGDGNAVWHKTGQG